MPTIDFPIFYLKETGAGEKLPAFEPINALFMYLEVWWQPVENH